MFCPNCKNECADNSAFCPSCGTKLSAQQPNPNQAYASDYYQPDNSYDHTAEFDKKDISDNKVMSMLVYLMGIFGIIVALLAANNSPYTAFHVRQALKFIVLDMLMLIVTVLLCWTILVPIAFIILEAILFIARIVCFFQICKGQAKEPVIIRNLNFFK